jgi:hypothetical protein
MQINSNFLLDDAGFISCLITRALLKLPFTSMAPEMLPPKPLYRNRQ